MAGRFQPIVRVASGGVLGPAQDSLGFAARSVLIDNYTSQWIYERNFAHFIQPYWAHTILPLDGPQSADVVVAAPPNFGQAAVNNTENYRVTYLEDALAYNAGQSVSSLIGGGPTSTSTNLTQIGGTALFRPPTYIISANNISQVFTGGDSHQILTIQSQSVNSIGQAQIRKVVVTIESNTVAGIIRFALIHLTSTTVASGGTNLTPCLVDSSQPALGQLLAPNPASWQAKPTTAASFDTTGPQAGFNVGVIAGATSDMVLGPLTLYDFQSSLTENVMEKRPLAINPGFNANEGWGLLVTAAAATTAVFTVWVEMMSIGRNGLWVT